MRIDNLSGRIFLTLGALIVLLLGSAVVFGEMKLRSVLGESSRERMATALETLLDPATEILSGQGDLDHFRERLRDLGTSQKLRFTLVAADGSVTADSEARIPLANHAERPEIAAARDSGAGESERRSATTGKESFYVARRVERAGKYLGTVRVATEYEDVVGAVTNLRTGVAWFAVGALGAGIAAALLLTRWLARPMEALEQSARQLAAGDLDRRVHAEGPLEVRRLGEALDTMARELKTRLETTRRARTEIETILSSMAEGVVAVDSKERVLLMNGAAAELLGLETPLEPGAKLWEHIRFPELERGLRSVLAAQGPWQSDAVSPRQDGRVLGLSVAAVAPHVENGEAALTGAVALLSDVTAIRRLERVRIDFVANVSHELRTPLAAVMGALETLADPEQDERTHARLLDIASRNSARLQAIVADLLDLSSIEAEGDRMPLEPVRVDAPLRTAASALAGAAESKGVKIDLPPPLPAPVLVNGNTQRLEQVFTNLLENAIKYTPGGGRITVRLRATPREVSVEVEDTGIGIPTAALTRVFERFYRVDQSRTRDGGRAREVGGTGLGLAIVKHVLRAHGGQVSVKSEEGSGSTFTVLLPRIPEPEKTFRN